MGEALIGGTGKALRQAGVLLVLAGPAVLAQETATQMFSAPEVRGVVSFLSVQGRSGSERFCWLERVCSAGAGLGQGNGCEGTLLTCMSEVESEAKGEPVDFGTRTALAACRSLQAAFTPAARALIAGPQGCGASPPPNAEKATLTRTEAECLLERSCSYGAAGSDERRRCERDIRVCIQDLRGLGIRARSACRRFSKALFEPDATEAAAKFGCRRQASGSIRNVWASPALQQTASRAVGGGAAPEQPPPKDWEEQVNRLQRQNESDDFEDF
ncbi:MAG: hypothetical protein AAF184_10565 [Pseudomonadota bacterium]